ncbi:AAA family ATPase [Lentzea sp. NPDC092896]|uniref:AAA family ATPase n=1 Tax=Lentzea sp. NPDC092896 TaxID=3364127 RepID=UPI003827808D
MSSSVLMFRERFNALQDNVEQFVRGKSEVVLLALTCFFAEGHLLIEDVPGVAKTSLAKALAGSVGGDFHRVQFTPDLLPSDVTGVEIFNPRTLEFQFRRGPVFANVLLGDEINRASPKTQSALLQVMAEQEVTVGLTTYPAPRPFFCVATQNSVEHQGTYPLPEAQMDRFLMRTSIGYPSPEVEREVVGLGVARARADDVAEVMSIDEVASMIAVARDVEVSEQLREYVVRIVTATRNDDSVLRGASPRGSIALATAAQVVAASRGRQYATPDDVKSIAEPVLAHRIQLKQAARVEGVTAESVIASILRHRQVTVPRAG